MDLINLCRLCLTKNENSIDIFGKDGRKAKIAVVLAKHFWFQILENEQFSQIICTKCWQATESFHIFYKNIEFAQKKLTADSTTLVQNSSCFGSTDVKSEDLNKPDLHDNNLVALVEATLEQRYVSTNDTDYIKYEENNDQLYDENVSYTEDPVEITEDYFHRSDSTATSDDSDYIIASLRKRKKRPVKKKPGKSEETCLKKIGKKREKSKKNVKTYSKDELLAKKEKCDKEDVQIREFFKMECSICGSKFDSYLHAKAHYRTVHDTSGYLVCCNRKFRRRGKILEHIDRHLNPDHFKCEICNKTYVDKISLNNHFEDQHPMADRKFKCTHCEKSFPKQFKLSIHIRNKHSTDVDKKFDCEICSKSFSTKYLLKSHIRGVHQFEFAQVCDICAKVFKSKQVFESHRLTHLNIMPTKVQCTICGAWLAHEHSLRAHMIRHKDVEQKCALCDKVAPNKSALGNHMRAVHIDRLFQCSMCDKSFKRSIGLKEHIAVHTGENLYTCPYCPKTFKSGANMHKHRKISHLTEFERDRRRNIIPMKTE